MDVVTVLAALVGRAVVTRASLSFTFALANVVLEVATSKDHPVNSFHGPSDK